MARWSLVWLFALSVFSSAAVAEDADRESLAQRKRLVQQKLRLVEALTSSRTAAAPERFANSRKLLDSARTALAADRIEDAADALDEILRNAAKPSAHDSARSETADDRAYDYRKLAEQLSSYRVGIEAMAHQGSADASQALQRIDALGAEAQKLASGGRMDEANRKLAEAYQVAVVSVAKLRAGQTVTLSLKFDTPAAEYIYELNRFQSNETLVAMFVGEGRANDGERRDSIAEYIRAARQLHGAAGDQAATGDYQGAVAIMEKASAQLNRALQQMGVPVF